MFYRYGFSGGGMLQFSAMLLHAPPKSDLRGNEANYSTSVGLVSSFSTFSFTARLGNSLISSLLIYFASVKIMFRVNNLQFPP